MKNEIKDQINKPTKIWHVLQVRSGTEKAVTARLRDRGHDAYCPLFFIPKFRTLRIVPLFPKYVFISLIGSSGTAFLDDRDVYSVLIGAGSVWISIHDEVINEIKKAEHAAIEKHRAYEEVAPIVASFSYEEPVETTINPFIKGIFEKQIDNERCAILVDMCGRMIRTTVALSALTRSPSQLTRTEVMPPKGSNGQSHSSTGGRHARKSA